MFLKVTMTAKIKQTSIITVNKVNQEENENENEKQEEGELRKTKEKKEHGEFRSSREMYRV